MPVLEVPDSIEYEYDTNQLKEALQHPSAREWIKSLGKPVNQLTSQEKAYLCKMFA